MLVKDTQVHIYFTLFPICISEVDMHFCLFLTKWFLQRFKVYSTIFFSNPMLTSVSTKSSLGTTWEGKFRSCKFAQLSPFLHDPIPMRDASGITLCEPPTHRRQSNWNFRFCLRLMLWWKWRVMVWKIRMRGRIIKRKIHHRVSCSRGQKLVVRGM